MKLQHRLGHQAEEDVKSEMATDMTAWNYKEEWLRRGTHFMVSVRRHSLDPEYVERGEGGNRWCVYAYIYPEHWSFNAYAGDDMWQPAATELPLHGGVSFLKWHFDEHANCTSVQVGADYNHLCDETFTWDANPEEAVRVFRDAENLFNHLSADQKATEAKS